jgi:hypothetical protein
VTGDRFALLRDATASAILGAEARTPLELRVAVARGETLPDGQSNLARLVEKIRSCAYTVTDGDVDAVRDHFPEDQLFELIVAAAFGAAQERLDAARRALEEA